MAACSRSDIGSNLRGGTYSIYNKPDAWRTEHFRCFQVARRQRRGMIESMKVLDGSLTASVAMLTGLSPQKIEELGGVGDWEK